METATHSFRAVVSCLEMSHPSSLMFDSTVPLSVGFAYLGHQCLVLFASNVLQLSPWERLQTLTGLKLALGPSYSHTVE
jgi:hypothetical protein